jgi:diketogulonate reductase-like aldo/keto reductase
LRTNRLDLYLLHWRGRIPLEETIEGFESLVDADKIRYWGVSNFDLSEIRQLIDLPGGANVTTNQVLYNLTRRGIEYDLLPWCLDRGIPIMAYAPIEQGRLLTHPSLKEIALRHGAQPAQIALAWVLRMDRIIAIPRAAVTEHVRDNRAALDIKLSEKDLAALDCAFPPPTEPQQLEML